MSKKVLSPNVPPFVPKNYAFTVDSLESCCGSNFNAHKTLDCQPHCSHMSMYCSTEQQEICASGQVIEPKFQVPHVTEIRAEARRGPVLSHNYTQWFSHESGKEAPFIKQYLSEQEKSSYLKDKNIPNYAVTLRDMFSSKKSVCQEEMSNQKASKLESEESSSKYITSCSARPEEKCYLQNKPTNLYDLCKNLDLSGEIASDTMPQNKKFINNIDDFPCLPCSPSKPWLKNSQKPDMTNNKIITDIAYSEKLKSVCHVPSNKLGCDNMNSSIKIKNDKSKKNNSLFSVKQHYVQSKNSGSPCRNYSSVCSTVSVESSKLQFDYVSDKRYDFKSDRKIPVKNDAFLEQPKDEKIYENHSERKFGKSVKYHYSIEKNNGNVSYSSKSNIKNGIKSSSTNPKIHAEATRNDCASILNRSNPISSHNINEKTKDMQKVNKAKDIENNDKTILNNTSETSNLHSIQKSSTSGRKLKIKENTLVKDFKESPKLQTAGSINLNKINDEVTSTRKKKKRKSQLKRQTAFQMGKVTVVSPEVHSRITGNLTYNNSNYHSNIHVDVANPDEYPELGQVQHKENKTAIKYSKRKPKEIAINHHKDSVNSSIKTNVNPKGNSIENSSMEKLLHLFKYSDALKISKPELKVKQLNRKCSEETTNNISSGANEISEVETLLGNAENFLANFKGPEHRALEVKRFGAEERYPDSCRKEEEKQKRNVTRTRKSLETSQSKMKHSSDAPLEISFCDILTNSNVKIKNIQREIRNRVISTKRSKLNRDLHGPHNLLDSSSPLKKRGKERETPKKKKKSALKKIILLERKEKKANRSLLKDKSKELVESISINTERLNTVEENKFGVQSETELSTNEINEESSLSALTVQKSTNDEEMINQVLMKKDIPEVQDSEINAECLQENKDSTSASSLMPLSGENRLRAVQLILHTNNFREYCNHLISEELDTVVLTLLSDLARFQDRMYQKDPVKARMKRRLVYGLKEVTKHLKLRKLKCIIIAPDVENIKAQGGLNDALANIVHLANESHIPSVFALRKKSLGKACIKPVPVSCVGIFNYEGSEANFRKLVELHADSKKAYDVMVNNIEEHLSENIVKKLLEAETTSHLALHSLRTEFLRQIFVSKMPAGALTVKPKITKKYVDEISGCSSEVVI